ncbi:MAG: ABC transporter ATP-binding protein [Desulfurococcales archaeon]|nr:ABC transporter ATP-binding protein [Desulfurococcales archaeon]
MRREIVVVEDLYKYFNVVKAGKRRVLKAVDGVSFKLRRGEILGLVGESGSGKTTVGRLVTRLLKPTRGRILFDGIDIAEMPEKRLRPLRRRFQMVFQDPYASLNPRMPIGKAIAEPLVVHGLAGWEEAKRRALELLEKVGLTPAEDFYNRLPSQLSGGQRQRAVIARAVILEPDFIVADEPVSMVDVSMRASILDLLVKLRRELGTAMLFITHDLAVAKMISDRIAVMYVGKIVEEAPSDELVAHPMHPYTRALITSVPSIAWRNRRRFPIKGDIADPTSLPMGCRYHPRCPLARDKCRREEPALAEARPGHLVACHYPVGEPLKPLR